MSCKGFVILVGSFLLLCIGSAYAPILNTLRSHPCIDSHLGEARVEQIVVYFFEFLSCLLWVNPHEHCIYSKC